MKDCVPIDMFTFVRLLLFLICGLLLVRFMLLLLTETIIIKRLFGFSRNYPVSSLDH